MNVAFVTGAGSGLGLELCRELLAGGWRVAMYSRNPTQLAAAARALDAGDRVLALGGDVNDAGRLREAVREAAQALGPIDLAIANAGQRAPTWAADFSAAPARELMQTNHFGMLNLFEAVVPAMQVRASGSFVAVASLAGLRSLPGGAGYSASKAAIQAFLDTVRPELEPRGVRVVTVNPWFIRTTGKDDGLRRPLVVEPQWAARRIVSGIRSGQREIDFPVLAALAWRTARLLPNAWFVWLFRPRWGNVSLGQRLMQGVARVLPRA